MFEQRIPQLKMLRLCHKFGRGENVHLTRIPPELRLLIEEFILDDLDHDGYSKWTDSFECIECRCDPVSHIDDKSELEDAALDDGIDLCDTCKDAWWYDEKCFNLCKNSKTDQCEVCTGEWEGACQRTCASQIRRAENEMLHRSGGWGDEHEDNRQKWRDLICMGPGSLSKRLSKVHHPTALSAYNFCSLIFTATTQTFWSRCAPCHDYAALRQRERMAAARIASMARL